MKNITLCISKILVFVLLCAQSAYANDLPEHIVSWAHQNPIVTVGVDATFPPFDYVNEQGDPAGVGKIIRQQLSEILPINLQSTSISNFTTEYNKLLNNELDAISVCGNTQARQGEVLFSTPFLQMTPILVVNANSAIKHEDDIKKSSRIASIKGYADAEFVSQLSALNIEVENNISGYEEVERGSVDGFITYLYLYKYMINKYDFPNIVPIAVSKFNTLNIGFCINKNKPELVEIINWGIDKLGKDYITEHQAQWTDPIKTDKELSIVKEKGLDVNTLLIYAILTALGIVLMVIFIVKPFNNIIAIKFDTTSFRFSFYSILVLIVIALYSAINIFLNDFKKQVILDQQETFDITREVTEKALKGWYKERHLFARNITKNKEFTELVTQLVSAERNDDQLLKEDSQKQLRDFFTDRPFTTLNKRSYTLSNLKGEYLLNYIESAEGKISTIKVQRPELFEKVINGYSNFIPPVLSNVDIDGNTSANDHDAEIFVASPVRDEQGTVIAVLALRYDPNMEFSKLFIDGRIGKTFETYAIDDQGYLLSESRFNNSLQQEGLVPFGENTILHLRLPDVENNPIVHAARFKLDGQNLTGYQGYRGNLVVGQWLTFHNFNFTIVSEIDYDELYGEYYTFRNILYVGLLILVTLIFSLSFFMISISRKFNEIGRRSRDELTEQVNERTKELAASELKSNLINSSVADGILGVNKQGNFIFANESATRILEYSEEDLIKQNIITIFARGKAKAITFEKSRVYESIKTQKVIRVPHEDVVINNDKVLPIEFSISPVDDNESELAAVIAFQDITQRIQDNERVETILENLPVSMVIMNRDDKIDRINQTGIELLGYSKEEIIGKPVNLFIPNEQESSHKALLDKFFDDKITIDTRELDRDFRIQNKAGQLIDIQAVYTPVYFHDGLYAAVMVRDITPEKQAKEALLVAKALSDEAASRTEKLLALAPAALVIFNKEEMIIQVNDSACLLFKSTKERLVNQNLSIIVPEARLEEHFSVIKNYIKNPESIPVGEVLETTVKTSEQEILIAEALFTPITINNEELFIVGIRDISKEYEAKHALIEAKQIADDASKAKSDFLANMSHEIRTPMNAIMGMSHLALGCGLDKKPKNYVTKVYNAAESLLGIINDILDFSKIEAGKLDLEQIDFNIHDVLNDLSNIIGLKTYEKGLELLFDIDKSVPLILKGDPLRLNQILINIAGNAVKFTEQGEIVISAKVIEKPEQNNTSELTIQFEVKDSGIGMNREQKNKLFKSFSQADSSTTRKYGGTGLGLTISKKLVELMQGDIWLESEEGQGSSFFFTTNFQHSELNNSKLIDKQKSFLSNKRILIVDDNVIALDVLKSILESFDCKVITANSGVEAIEIAKQATTEFDFIMVDWQMPELDGIETCRIIKEHNNYTNKHFILVSSKAHDEDTLLKIKSSIDSVLVKPVTASSVFDQMMHLHGDIALRASREIERDDTLIENQKRLAGSKILLVEDNELNQELALELLSQAGIIADLAENGELAVEMVDNNKYDGVLMDLQMPVMDGITATGIIRKNYPLLPIIAMTANAMAGDKERVLAAGMNDHITKPINVSNMFNTMTKWIKPSSPVETIEVNHANKDEEILPEFININVEAGLAVTNDNRKLYIKLLGKFITGQEDFNEKFTKSWQENDIESATRCAHTLKGSAGNIGAIALQDSAGKLESACSLVDINTVDTSEQDNSIDDVLIETNEELLLVLNELKDFCQQNKVNQESSAQLDNFTFDDSMLSNLTHLLELVEDFETDAIEVAEPILEQLVGYQEEKPFSKIIENIEGYDFTKALQQLTDFIAQAKIQQ